MFYSLEQKQRGNKELAAGHFTAAVRYYTAALALTPSNPPLLSNRALAYIKLESYGLAIQDASRAITTDPTFAKAFYRRGTANFALQKAKLARKDFRQVCKLKPKDRDARAKLAECEKAVREAAFAMAIESEETLPLSSIFDADKIGIDAGGGGYDGPHPGVELLEDMEAEKELFNVGALPMEFVMASIKHMEAQKLVHKRYIARLLIACQHYFASLPSLISIPTPTTKITVCGDTHGQFYDVLNIWKINGYPSATNPYLFNGDFVDRGSFSLEVIVSYLLLKLACPEGIFLLRGNHETRNMNKIYGFEGEVRHKYDDKIFQLFLEVFCHLPLAATIGGEIFITHGGLPTEGEVTLEDIKNIKRGREPPESGLMSDLLWSDPQPFNGRSPSKRGVGYAFGPDITDAFLKRNGLKLLVRSHEVKDEGYLVEHGGKTITVFSAPNYCDSMENKGAFIQFDQNLDKKFVQFEAVSHPDVRPMAYAAGMGGLFA
mmetsp:Transcript_15393/g.19234  ORF Transcript_15393/g.19234 Transcript_15393/m.19234 type:complete len:490 (-) Transcript_15393:160-1629(-)